MKLLLIGMGLTVFFSSAQAVERVAPPGLMPTHAARALLEQDPGVAAARARLDVARHEAGILDRSPYEWTTRATGQQRRVDAGSRYNEWNVGVERTLRLPGKAAADRDIGKATLEAAEAHYGEALHEAARELMSLWVDWLGAERSRELAVDSLRSVEQGLLAVDKRARAGDASKLDVSIARAELAEQRRLHNDAKTQAAAAQARVATRFPGADRPGLPLPVPLALTDDAAQWRERILEESDELKVAQARMRVAEAHARRARAEKTPDPTLGIYTTSEMGGRERIYGVAISIPIPGSLRNARSAKAAAAIEVSRQETELKRRQLEADAASAFATASGSYDSLHIANEGAAAMQENANLAQRAYALGEAELQAMLLARRQATAAMGNAVQAQVSALKAYYGLLIDAHLVWELEHD